MKVEAKWTGSYPCLCSGEWILKVNNIDVSNLIPEELRTSSMNTFGSYSSWYFTEDWNVEDYYYLDGLECEDWIKDNKDWLDKITTAHSVQKEIYYTIQLKDFRAGSCGGCI